MRAHAYVFFFFIISFSSVCARSRGPHSSNQLICSRHCAALGLFMCARVFACVCECVPRARSTMRTLTPAGSWPRIRETHFVFCSVFSRARHARTLASTRTRPVIGAGRSVCVRACSVETQIHAIHAVYIESRPASVRACVRVIATMRARSTLLPGPGRPYARTNLIRSL